MALRYEKNIGLVARVDGGINLMFTILRRATAYVLQEREIAEREKSALAAESAVSAGENKHQASPTAHPVGLRPPALIEAVLHVLSVFAAGGEAQISAIYKAGGFKLAIKILASSASCGYSTSYGVTRACFSLLSHCANASKYASIMGKESSPGMLLLRA